MPTILADRYLLVEERQSGGMATVYKARDINISHPNVVQLLDSGDDASGKSFLVLEWMPCDLLEYKQRGERAFDGWDDFAEQIALPLKAAAILAQTNQAGGEVSAPHSTDLI
jgi:serine/threonine protein kinase